MDEWRSLIFLLINAFLRLYHVLHIYSTNAGELIKKFDSLINESISTELNNIFELLTLDSSLFCFLVFGTILLVDVRKSRDKLLYLRMSFVCLSIRKFQAWRYFFR